MELSLRQLDIGRYRIGRSPECEIHVAINGLSREHALLDVLPNGGVVIDQPIIPGADGTDYTFDAGRPATIASAARSASSSHASPGADTAIVLGVASAASALRAIGGAAAAPASLCCRIGVAPPACWTVCATSWASRCMPNGSSGW